MDTDVGVETASNWTQMQDAAQGARAVAGVLMHLRPDAQLCVAASVLVSLLRRHGAAPEPVFNLIRRGVAGTLLPWPPNLGEATNDAALPSAHAAADPVNA